MGPTLVDPRPAGAPALARLRRARAGAPAGHGSTSVGAHCGLLCPPINPVKHAWAGVHEV